MTNAHDPIDRGALDDLSSEVDPADRDPGPDAADPRRHQHDPEQPEADALEQELPVVLGAEPLHSDADRVEPIDDETSYGDPEHAPYE